MTLDQPVRGLRVRTDPRRQAWRAAAALSLGLGVLYGVLLVLVADAETGAGENTFGAYLFLSLAYLALSGLLAVSRSRWVLAFGLAVQVLVLGLFVTLGVGVFDYDLLAPLRMEIWAAVITLGELVLLGLLGYLRWGAGRLPGGRSPR